eukprot:GEMP01027136.1.p1 GENE.GEMP01027136.1~~GEMP01027136.1.p1  ORF type:complete len:585 (+),score=117.25 GEMP01027136.1:46-1800(+)
MADTINERLEEMVPGLTDLEQKGLFNRAEIKKIIEKRRAFEYRLISNPSVYDYLKYVEYELNLEQLRRQRRHTLGWKKRTLSDSTGVQHIISIYARAVAGQFKGDVKLWFQYLDFCLESGSSKLLQRVLLKALRIHPKEERLWILAADRELRLGHLKAARTMLLRALRFAPKSVRLWQQYLKLECLVAAHVQKVTHAPATDVLESEEGTASETKLPEASAGSDTLVSSAPSAAVSPSTPIESSAVANGRNATLGVLGFVVRKACAQLEQDSSEFLTFAHRIASDHMHAADAAHTEGWRHFQLDVERVVDEMLELNNLSIWTVWWTLTGPRDVKEQLEIVLTKGTDDVLVSWIHSCPCVDTVIDQLAINERVRGNPKAVAALPLTTEAAKECLRAAVAGSAASDFGLQVRLWSIDAPSTKDMFAACKASNVDASSVRTFVRALPVESRVDGFLDVVFRIDPRSCHSLALQLLAFQLAVSLEAYRACIKRLTKELPKNPKSLNHGEHLLAIVDAVLLTDTRLGTPGLEPLFEQACATEKSMERLVDLWIRYEVYVEEQGGDAAAIRRRASRVVPPQALVEYKIQMD